MGGSPPLAAPVVGQTGGRKKQKTRYVQYILPTSQHHRRCMAYIECIPYGLTMHLATLIDEPRLALSCKLLPTAVQMFVIKNLDTGTQMRIDDFDRLAHIATDPDPAAQVCLSTLQAAPAVLQQPNLSAQRNLFRHQQSCMQLPTCVLTKHSSPQHTSIHTEGMALCASCRRAIQHRRREV